MKIQTFIFVHNQDIILDFIENEKFKNLNNLKYVFLGNKEIDKVINLDNVIIARNFEKNIEDFPKLTSYTGWYVLWKNNLIDADYINLFEYDINIDNDFESKIYDCIKNEKPEVIGYVPFHVHEPAFLKMRQWSDDLINAIKKTHGIDILEFVSSLPHHKECSITSNHTFSKTAFRQYMEWMETIINDIKYSNLSGHQVERSIIVFYLLNNLPYKVFKNMLHHFQFDSHQTQGIEQNKFINNYKFLLNTNG